MSFLVLKAYLKLIQFGFYLAQEDFATLHKKVRNYPVGKSPAVPVSVERICAAVDMAKPTNAIAIQGRDIKGCLPTTRQKAATRECDPGPCQASVSSGAM